MLAHYFQIPEKEVAAKSVPDPRKAVAVDVAVHRRPSTDDSRLASGKNRPELSVETFLIVKTSPVSMALSFFQERGVRKGRCGENQKPGLIGAGLLLGLSNGVRQPLISWNDPPSRSVELLCARGRVVDSAQNRPTLN